MKKDIKNPAISKVVDSMQPLVKNLSIKHVERYNRMMELNNAKWESQKNDVEPSNMASWKERSAFHKSRVREMFPLTASQIESYETSVQMDIIRAMANYIVKTDTFVSVKFGVQNQAFSSVFELSANIDDKINAIITVSREGVKHILDTKAILAGGHSVQRLHYRYIVKTDLPAIDAKPYMSWLEKHEGLIQEIDRHTKQFAEAQEKFDKMSVITLEEFIKQDKGYSFTKLYNQDKDKYSHLSTERIEELLTRDQEELLQKYKVSTEPKSLKKQLNYNLKEQTNYINKAKAKLQKLEEGLK